MQPRLFAAAALLLAPLISTAGPKAEPVATVVPSVISEFSAEDRLLTCKETFTGLVTRHAEASKALKKPADQEAAKQAAVDQALALAVLGEALPDAGAPEEKHVEAAKDKRSHADLVTYCRRIVLQYVAAQEKTNPRYLVDLRPTARDIVQGILEPGPRSE